MTRQKNVRTSKKPKSTQKPHVRISNIIRISNTNIQGSSSTRKRKRRLYRTPRGIPTRFPRGYPPYATYGSAVFPTETKHPDWYTFRKQEETRQQITSQVVPTRNLQQTETMAARSPDISALQNIDIASPNVDVTPRMVATASRKLASGSPIEQEIQEEVHITKDLTKKRLRSKDLDNHVLPTTHYSPRQLPITPTENMFSPAENIVSNQPDYTFSRELSVIENNPIPMTSSDAEVVTFEDNEPDRSSQSINYSLLMSPISSTPNKLPLKMPPLSPSPYKSPISSFSRPPVLPPIQEQLAETKQVSPIITQTRSGQTYQYQPPPSRRSSRIATRFKPSGILTQGGKQNLTKIVPNDQDQST